jgi:hypothetical protein
MFIIKVNTRKEKAPIISSYSNTSIIGAITMLRTILRYT